MVSIRKNLMPESLYSWKSPYTMSPTRIVVHNTANDASADSEIKYMNKSKSQGGIQTSFHYAVDDKEIVQGLPENRNGWHAGDGANGKGNRQGIAIEICYSKSGGDRFIKAEENAVDLIVDILKRYNWGIDKVTKHQDYANKYCPHRTLDMGWDRFINMVKTKLGDTSNEASGDTQNNSNGIIADIQNWYNANYSSVFGSIAVDNSFGPDTKKHMIQALQFEMNKQYGSKLDRDGSFGPASKNAFRNLKVGMSGNITRVCQAFLYKKGYNPNGFDGSYGLGMQSAVRNYQSKNGLKIDGILGPSTAYSLFN